MIKAIIFDCFGVLVQGSLEQFIDSHFAYDSKKIEQAHNLNDQCSLGLISYEDQIIGFAEMAGLSVDATHQEMDNNPRNEQLLKFIRTQLKPKYKIGFLSNAGADWTSELFDENDLSLFDDFVLSYNVKLAKPDVRIYKLSANKLNVDPRNCVFIDDIERYCIGARDAGMQTVKYKNFYQMKKDLESILEMGDSDK